MSNQEKITNILSKLDVDITDESKKLMSDFFASIQNQALFDRMTDLLDKFPSVLDNFAKCFQNKINFFKNNGTEEDWKTIVNNEKQTIENIS
jgi:uncharacterized protein YpuA (DUF1002 family)